jgi:hypothetical protein
VGRRRRRQMGRPTQNFQPPLFIHSPTSLHKHLIYVLHVTKGSWNYLDTKNPLYYITLTEKNVEEDKYFKKKQTPCEPLLSFFTLHIVKHNHRYMG